MALRDESEYGEKALDTPPNEKGLYCVPKGVVWGCMRVLE